jgi:hypothetical protein
MREAGLLLYVCNVVMIGNCLIGFSTPLMYFVGLKTPPTRARDCEWYGLELSTNHDLHIPFFVVDEQILPPSHFFPILYTYHHTIFT